jgi:hypothetical protein
MNVSTNELMNWWAMLRVGKFAIYKYGIKIAIALNDYR